MEENFFNSKKVKILDIRDHQRHELKRKKKEKRNRTEDNTEVMILKIKTGWLI